MPYDIGFGFVVVLLYVLPALLLWKGSYVTIHDNLDSEFVYRVVLVQNPMASDSDTVGCCIMGGLPRACLPTDLNFFFLLMKMLGPFTAYQINTLIVHFVAFLGMYLLLRQHFPEVAAKRIVLLGTSLAFALLPFYTIHGLSIAGQPLLLYAFLNLLKGKQRIPSFLIVLIFPFYSSLYFAGFFVLLALSAMFLFHSFKNHRISLGFLTGLLILGGIYALVEHRLIHLMFLDTTFVSHRAGWDLAAQSYGFASAFKASTLDFLFGQYHAISSHSFVLVVAILTLLFFHTKNASKQPHVRLMLLLLVVAAAFSLLYGFFNWQALLPIRDNLGILRAFNFSRFYCLAPLLWYLVFALSLFILGRVGNHKRIVLLLVVVQLAYSVALSDWSLKQFDLLNLQTAANEFRINAGILVDRGTGRKSDEISYAQFFSKPIFEEISEYIARPKKDYRIVNIGLYPSIPQYNGFYTLDSYQFNYPLEYKNRFRQIIAGELARSEKWREYFDGWGSRCYIFVAELENEPFAITKDSQVKISNLEVNTQALKEMGGEYVFSAVEIENAAENNLTLLRVFERNDSPWRIYLYKVN